MKIKNKINKTLDLTIFNLFIYSFEKSLIKFSSILQ